MYKRGKQLSCSCSLADTKFRAPRSYTVQRADEELNFDVMTVNYKSPSQLEELKRDTAADTSRHSPSALSSDGSGDFPLRDELSFEDRVIMKGHKAVVPSSPQITENISVMHGGCLNAGTTYMR